MASANKPPVLPRTLPAPAKRTLSPLAIVAIGVTGVTTLFAIGLLAVGLIIRARAAEAREVKAAPPSVSNVRVIRSDRPVAPAARDTQAGPLMSAEGPAKPEHGLSYTNIKVASEPWSIHVLKI